MRSFGLDGTNHCFGVCPLNENMILPKLSDDEVRPLDVPESCKCTTCVRGGGGGGVQAVHFEQNYFELGVGGDGQDTFRHFEDSFRSIRAILPIRGLGAKTGANTRI